MKNLILALALVTTSTAVFAATEQQPQMRAQVQLLNTSEPTTPDQREIDRYSYYFGRVWTNSTQYASYRLTNTGTTPLTFQQATISGANFDGFHSCRNGLQPQQSCNFDIRYSPFFEGYHSGRFILSFVENLDIVVDVWGEAYRP